MDHDCQETLGHELRDQGNVLLFDEHPKCVAVDITLEFELFWFSLLFISRGGIIAMVIVTAHAHISFLFFNAFI